MAVSWRITVFQKFVLWNPCFIVFWGCARFWPGCQKREILDTHQKIWLITEKLFFSIFVCFFVSLSFSVFGCFFCFLGGFKGEVRWPEGPPHLALNPPYCFLFFFAFPFFAFNRENLFSHLEKGIFLFILECLALFLLSLFLASPFFSFSLSVSLSLSLSLLFFYFCLSFFFVVFLFLLSFLLSSGSLFSLFLSFSVFLAFVSWKDQHQNIQLHFL